MKIYRVLSLFLVMVASLANAQEYPGKPITIIVPFASGGPTDTVARSFAQAMSHQLKNVPVTVENLGGAGGTLGATKASKAAPDGYMLLLHNLAHAVAPAMYAKLFYDPVADFAPIGLIVNVPMTVIARPTMGASNLKELLAYMKEHKDQVKLGNAGTGSASHMCDLLLLSKAGIPAQTVPFKGTALAMKGLEANQFDVMCDQTTNTMDEIKSGKVKVYGVTTHRRLDALPNVPTMAEGGMPDIEMQVWHGLYAPKGTPAPVLQQLNAALKASLKDPAFMARMKELGAEVVSQNNASPEALRALLKSDIDKWGPVIKKAGVYAE